VNFGLSEDQQAIRAAARQFAQAVLRPGYQQRERAGKLDRATVLRMGALGLIAPGLPEAMGGQDLDSVTLGLLHEELARGDFNLAYLPLLAALNGQILLRCAREEVARQYLPGLARGEVLSALALTEPHAGSDAAHIRLQARRDGARYLLNGEKASISLAMDADVAITFVRTGSEADGARGISALLVPLDAPGVRRVPSTDVGSLIVGRGALFFDEVSVPSRYLLGEEGRGFTQVMQGFDFSRALIGLQCLGAAAASLEETWAYASQRSAFGRPVVQFEGVSFPLAEAETLLEAARLLCLKTLWLKDQGAPHTAEAAMCKWWAPQVAFDVIHRCLLLHGHAGYGQDLPHQQRLRDVLGLQIGDGTAEIMKLIIARERAGRAAVPY
jgi:cyclohexanecarboxyl-CoA dehydrogenase